MDGDHVTPDRCEMSHDDAPSHSVIDSHWQCHYHVTSTTAPAAAAAAAVSMVLHHNDARRASCIRSVTCFFASHLLTIPSIVRTRRPASADRTARRQFQATGQPVSRTQASHPMTSRLSRYEAKLVCATQVLPMRVGPFAIRYQGNGATPCQYIDTTRKAIDCTTTLPLTVFI